MHDFRFDRYAIAIKISKKIKRKKSQSRYISRMREGALITPTGIEVCISV
jgi:hypothetical protein